MEALSWDRIGGYPYPLCYRSYNSHLFRRFRLINTAAREALIKGGFSRVDDAGAGSSSKAKGKEKKGKK